MNSDRDPMLAAGNSMAFFNNNADEAMDDPNTYFRDGFSDTNELMDDMFAISPQRSTLSVGDLKDQVIRGHPNTLAPPGSSPEDSSEDSYSDDSARHKRKSSSMSYHTDVDMLGGSKYPASMNENTSHQMQPTVDTVMINSEAMFDFESAASSPSPSKPTAGSNTLQHDLSSAQRGPAASREAQHDGAGTTPRVKAESIATASPSMSVRRSPVAQVEPSSASTSSAISGSSQMRSRMYIHRIPPKSRVETQIPIKITVSSLPEGVDKVHLPTHTISKPKLIVRPSPERSADMLELHSMLVCTSAMQDPTKREQALRRAAAKTRDMETKEKEVLPREGSLGSDDPENPLNGGEVHICQGCITRERKRAARKKSKKPDEEAAWASDEARRVVVFNTNEIRQWEDPEDEPDSDSRGRSLPASPPGSKQVKMPMRIACYCRHHTEKLGFQVILTLKDHQDQLIGQAMSDPIIITDDHKAQPLSASSLPDGSQPEQHENWLEGTASKTEGLNFGQLSRNAFSSNDLSSLQMMQASVPAATLGFSPFASAQPQQLDAKGRVNRSRQASPATSGGPLAKRRKANAGPKLLESLMMTKAQEPNPSGAVTPIVPPLNSVGATSATSPVITPFGFTFSPSTSQPPSGKQQPQRTPSFPSGPPTPDSSTNDFWATSARAQSFDTNAQSMFSAPSSRMPSRAASPTTHTPHGIQNVQPRLSQAYGIPGPQIQQPQRAPIINKIVPHEGPVAGGIEVTCLGSGFYNGLEVVFGNSPATTTTYWGETTLVCLLPPADRQGPVAVTFKRQNETFPASIRQPAKQFFTYIDDEEAEVFRHAFLVLSQKIAGPGNEDPVDLARKIGAGEAPGPGGWSSFGSGGGSYRQMGAVGLGQASESTESMVMRCLELIDMDDSPYPANLDAQRANGQTLLHLASSLGYQRLVAALLARGSNPNFTDRNGFSPLHMASLRGQAQIVRRLRLAGADPALQSRLGYTAAHLTTDSLTLQMLNTGSHLRSRSFGTSSLHSRSSSFGLATPPRSRASSVSHRATYNDDDDISSEEDEDESLEAAFVTRTRSWHQSRRNSLVAADISLKTPAAVTEISEHMTPAAAMVAWRDQLAAQIHQFQLSVEGMLPHLQMPTLPAIPPLPGIPNYQAPAMVRRFSSLVPQRSSRPSSPANSTGSTKESDHKWWDFFTGSPPTPASPPAYDEIFPEEDLQGLDRKAHAVASTQARNLKIQDGTSAIITAEASTTTAVTGSAQSVSIAQQEELRAAHARKMKQLRSDRNLFFVWIPLLLLLILIYFRERAIPQSWSTYLSTTGKQRVDPVPLAV